MKKSRRNFIIKSAVVLAGSFVELQKSIAQSLPFGFWNQYGSTGELRVSQAMLLSGVSTGASAELRVSQAMLIIAGKN